MKIKLLVLIAYSHCTCTCDNDQCHMATEVRIFFIEQLVHILQKWLYCGNGRALWKQQEKVKKQKQLLTQELKQ
jgi:hypothetical protein